MTLDQILLTLLVVATIAGAIVALYVHRAQARSRQRDLLRDFIKRLAAEIIVPTEVDAVRSNEEDLRLRIEQDVHFSLAFKSIPTKVRRQYKEFIKAGSTYIKTCHKLYEEIRHESAERTGLPAGRRGETRDWPIKVLCPIFVFSVYERVMAAAQNTSFRSEDISYNIQPFRQSGRDYKREGLFLAATYGDYNGLELAQADDEATLIHLQSIHRQMMEISYGKKFITEVYQVHDLKRKAERLAQKVSEELRKLEVS